MAGQLPCFGAPGVDRTAFDRADLEPGRAVRAPREPGLQMRVHDLAEIAWRIQHVEDDPVGQRPGQSDHARQHRGQINRNAAIRRLGQAPVVAHRIERAGVIDPALRRPLPHGADALDVLLHAGHGPAVFQAVPAFVPVLGCGAEAEDEAAPCIFGERHGPEFGQHRRPGEMRHRGAQPDVADFARNGRERHERVAPQFRGPDALGARLLGLPGEPHDVVERQLVAVVQHSPLERPFARHAEPSSPVRRPGFRCIRAVSIL